MKTTFLFQVWPYVALAILGLGLVGRYALAPRASGTDDAAARATALYGASRLWRIAFLILALLHLSALLIPRSVLAWNSVPVRLYLLEGTGFLFGLVALAGGASVAFRHLVQSKGSVGGEIADALFLSLLFVSVVSGLLTAAFYRWASNWGAATLTPYLASVLQGRASTELIAQLPFTAQLHVASAFGAAALLPFSGVGLLVVGVAHRMAAVALKPVAAGGRATEALLRRMNPAAWIWPEED
jgi:nitrate reductase gamma subunit